MTTKNTGMKVYFWGILLVAFSLGAIVLWPVKDVILLTWVVVTLFRPMHQFFVRQLKLGKMFGTLLTVTVIILSVILPIFWVFNITVSQFQVFYADISKFLQGGSQSYDLTVVAIDKINSILERIPLLDYRMSVDNIKILVQQNITPIANATLSWSLDIGVALAQSLPMIIIFIFLLGYVFPEYDRLIGFVKSMSPLTEDLDDLYLSRFAGMIKGIAKGILVIAVIQGAIAALSLWVAGVPYPFFWMIVLFFSAIIPPGTMLITVPASIILLALGNVWQAVFVAIIQFGLTSNIDNVLRPMLVPKEVDVHPALMLLSAIGGIQVFGVWGFIYGPLVMVIMITTFEIYQKHYKFHDRE